MSNDNQLPDGIPSWLRMTNENPQAAPAPAPPSSQNGTSSNGELPVSNGQVSKVGNTQSQEAHEVAGVPQHHGQQPQRPSTGGPQSPQQSQPPQSPPAASVPQAPQAPQFLHSSEQQQLQPSWGAPAQPQSSAAPQSQPEPQPPIQDGAHAFAPNTGKHHVQADFELKPPPALDQSNLVNPVKRAPRRGWRKMLYSVTGGHVNVGDSKQELQHDALLEQIRKPLRGDYRIAVMSLKGGVGKTTTTVTLGGVFASVRHDRVIAIDANPDLGTLAQRVAAPGPATIRDLLAAEDTSRYAEIRQYTTQAKSRLEVIGSERDPAVSESFSESDYRHAIDILQHHYNVILTDCGTGLMHSAMAGVLDLANTLVLVTSPALDGAQSASATLDWLNLHGYEQLAANAVVVVSAAHPGNATIDMQQLLAHFRSRTRAVHVIPFDRHLSEGATVDLERISKETLRAYHELAAIVAEDFDSWHRHAQG